MSPPPANNAASIENGGGAGTALSVAAEMVRRSHAVLSTGRPAGGIVEQLRRQRDDLVAVDVPMSIADIIERLRAGETPTELCVALVGRTIAEVERALILETLAHCQGNRTTAAAILGISVRTMRNKLRSFMEDGVAVIPAASV